jgi:4-hydroxybenzoate polyprenyltransferase
MIQYLRLIRLQNLLFIALIQFLMSEVVIVPILQAFGFDTGFDAIKLCLLISSTVLIAAGGYILNDYFDIKIDIINRPTKQIVGSKIPRRSAMLLHQVFTGLGVFLGLLLAFFAHSFTLAFIYIVVPGLLWFYSASYKRQFIIGNLVIAFVAGLTVLIVGIAQLAFLQKEYGQLIFETPIPRQFYGWIGGFALFSFLCTWIREIIKDIEDEKGDREMECRTMAIKWGTPKTKIVIYALITITISTLYVFDLFMIPFEGSLTTRYIFWGLTMPFVALAYLIYAAKTPANYHQASTLTKFIMVLGVCYSFIFYYLQAKTFGISLFNILTVK